MKTNNWYFIYKQASAISKEEFVISVFKELELLFNTKTLNSLDGYTLDKTIEKQESSDAFGESWIQVSHSRFSNGFNVEKYFENEFAQNEYGKSSHVDTDYVNVQECVGQIIQAVKSISSH